MRQIGFSRMALLLFGIVAGLLLRVQAAGIDELVEADSLERIATGFRFTEGPVWHPDGYLLFSDVLGNTIYKWVPDGSVETFRSPSAHANGLTFDRRGRLIACETSNRRVSRTEPDGTIVTLAREYNGSRLNSLNDAVVKSDGSIYFTDPPWGLPAGFGIPMPGTQELLFQGVYRLSPDGETLELLEADIYLPNGLAFSPDEKVLYLAATQAGTVYAFDVQPDGLLANRRVFTHLSGWPDGMKVDMRGNLYVTTNTSVVGVYDSEGMHLGDIVTPEATTNCAFGGDDNRTLFITAETSVYRVQMKVQGARPTPDFNGDGIVDCADICMMVDHWHTDNPRYDIGPGPFGDGIVDVQDLIVLAEHFEKITSDEEINVDEDDADGQVELEQGQILVVTLESNPSTGYRWEVAEIQESILEQLGEAEFKSSGITEPPPPGTGGWEIFRFKALSAGQMTLQLVYRRSWEEGVEPINTFSIEVVVN